MKDNEIEIGGVYYTRVGNRKRLVEVLERISHPVSGKTRYKVKRATTGTVLPKTRSARALHLTGFDRKNSK